MASLISGDSQKRDKIYKLFQKFHVYVSLLAFIAGLVWFFILPHKLHVHKTYMSENALSPGVVSSDIDSTEELTRYYDATKAFFDKEKVDFDWIRKQFEKIGIEVYTQDFNVTDPFVISAKQNLNLVSGRNIYAIARSHRTPGVESIVISAPLYYTSINKDNEEVVKNNVFGISQLFTLARLARSRSYWAKDLIFIVSEVGFFGVQAWLNSYFDVSSKYINGENLVARGGAIQAALNLQIDDATSDKLLFKLEGANGQLPNLDLFNTVIRMCRTYEFRCGFDKPQTNINEFDDYMNSLENTIKMMLRQSSGVPTSPHGFFLRHHIEALTIQGVQTRKNVRHNTLRMIRIVEGTLRSVNNLLERFHQSFFFYILPNENSYVSIGMYMPPLGLLILPCIVELLYLWQQLSRIKITNRNKPYKIDMLRFVLPDITLAIICSIINYIGTSYFVSTGGKLNLNPKDSLISSHLAITINSIFAPYLLRRKINIKKLDDKPGSLNGETTTTTTTEDELYAIQIQEISWNIKKVLTIFILTLLIGSLSLLNYSLAFLIAIFYIPVILTIRQYKNIALKLIQFVIILIICPLFTFVYFYLLYNYMNKLQNQIDFNSIWSLKDQFYEFLIISKVSSIWTYDLICLLLYPIWLSMWFLCN